MKVRASVKRICDKCKIVRREGQGTRYLRDSQAQAGTGITGPNKEENTHGQNCGR